MIKDIIIESQPDGGRILRHPSGVEVRESKFKVAALAKREQLERISQKAQRDFLARGPICDMQCPDGKTGICCEGRCVEGKGFYQPDEWNEFTEEQRQQIRALWDDKTGYLGPDGCRIPWNLRSFACLKYDCRLVR